MRAPLSSIVAISLSLSSVARAEPALDDTNVRSAGPITVAVHDLALCTWKSEQSTARRLVAQYVSQMGLNKDFQFSFKRTDFSVCGGNSALQTAITEPTAVIGMLQRIWVNQAARCVARSKQFTVAAVRSELAKSQRLKVGAKLSDEAKAMMALVAGEKLPPNFLKLVANCDESIAAWINSGFFGANWFLNELDYEAKRNA